MVAQGLNYSAETRISAVFHDFGSSLCAVQISWKKSWGREEGKVGKLLVLQKWFRILQGEHLEYIQISLAK